MDRNNPVPRGILNNRSQGEILSTASGSAPRRKLADISNLQERAKLPNQGLKQQQQQSTALPSKEYIEKLEKENMMLMKVLVERNKIIELSGIELRNLRFSLHKVQEQNLQLAQANSKILAELNTNKDKLKALHHELGCKNGVLKARNLLLEEQSNPMAYQTKVGKTEHGEAGDSIQADDGNNKTCTTKRRRHSMIKTSGESAAKFAAGNENDNRKRRVSARKNPKNPSKSGESNNSGISNEANEITENLDGKRRCLGRQSARFESQEPEETESLQEIHDAEVTIENERLSKQSIRDEDQAPEAAKNLHQMHDMNETAKNSRASVKRRSKRYEEHATLHEKQDAKETNNNQRTLLRGQATRLREPEPEPTGPTQKLTSLRRRSTRLKSQEPELSESMHETQDAKETTKNQRSTVGRRSTIRNSQASVTANNHKDDSRLPNIQLGDNTATERDQPPLESVKDHGEENRSSCETDVCEDIRRTSVGRPSRRATKKVQTYKEISLRVKMRRSE